MFWIMHPDNYPFNDDGFGVEVKPDEMGTVEVISAAASVAAGADDLTRPNFPPPSYSPAVGASSSPSWLDPSVAYASPDAAKSTTRPFDTTPEVPPQRRTRPGRRNRGGASLRTRMGPPQTRCRDSSLWWCDAAIRGRVCAHGETLRQSLWRLTLIVNPHLWHQSKVWAVQFRCSLSKETTVR